MAKREEKPEKSRRAKSGSGPSKSASGKKSGSGAKRSARDGGASSRSRSSAELDRPSRKSRVVTPKLVQMLKESARVALAHSVGNSQLTVRGIEPLPIAFVDRGAALPEGYGLDRLVILSRDPWTLFCYWELRGSRLRTLSRLRGETFVDSCAWALRLHRIDEGVAHDIEVDASSGCWYIHLDRQGRYQVELALLSPEGEWIPLLASHVINLPAAQPSQNANEVWSDPGERELSDEEREKLDEALWPEDLFGGSSGFTGSSRARSSFSSHSVRSSFVGSSSGSHIHAGSSARIPSSGGSMSIGGSSARLQGSGSGLQGVSWNPPEEVLPGDLPPGDERPGFFGGPNWNEQKELPRATASEPSASGGPGKSLLPHFKIHLPRVLAGLPLPEPTWPSTPGNTRKLAHR
jgi:hypothetical protein